MTIISIQHFKRVIPAKSDNVRGFVLRLIRYEIQGDAAAKREAISLIDRSKWFELTPLSDGCWEFVAKDEPGIPAT